jgi:hypothetical protein
MSTDAACCRLLSFSDDGKLVTSYACASEVCSCPTSNVLLQLTPFGSFTIHEQPKALKDGEIRLFVLCPGAKDDLIEGYLVHTMLSQSPAYKAVSWPWGDVRLKGQIKVNMSLFAISVNIGAALHTFRHETEPLLLWIDTLCIDQINFSERSQQVRLMRQIYSQADVVLAWLGPATAHSYHGITEFLATLLQSNEFDIADLPTGDTSLDPPTEATPYQQTFAAFQKALHGMVDITSRCWWFRLWVVQEILLARRAYLCIGNARVLWPRHHPSPQQSPVVAAASSAVWSLIKLQERLAPQHPRPSLLEVFTLTHDRDSTDPRDRVFAILGLVDPRDVTANAADYSLSLAQVQGRLFRSSVEVYKDLRILTHARGLCSGRSHASADCTWLPRWGNAQRKQELEEMFPSQPTGPTSFAELWNHHMMIAAIEDKYITAKVAYYAARPYKAAGASVPSLRMGSTPVLKGFVFDSIRSHTPYETASGKEWTDWLPNGCSSGTEGTIDTSLGIYTEFSNGTSQLEQISATAFRHMARIETAAGRRGNSTRFCQEDDLVCILFGGNVPYILRRTAEDTSERYLFVAEAYVDGVMEGQMMKELDEGLHQVQMFELV